jgi:hypothetical protein
MFRTVPSLTTLNNTASRAATCDVREFLITQQHFVIVYDSPALTQVLNIMHIANGRYDPLFVLLVTPFIVVYHQHTQTPLVPPKTTVLILAEQPNH